MLHLLGTEVGQKRASALHKACPLPGEPDIVQPLNVRLAMSASSALQTMQVIDAVGLCQTTRCNVFARLNLSRTRSLFLHKQTKPSR